MLKEIAPPRRRDLCGWRRCRDPKRHPVGDGRRHVHLNPCPYWRRHGRCPDIHLLTVNCAPRDYQQQHRLRRRPNRNALTISTRAVARAQRSQKPAFCSPGSAGFRLQQNHRYATLSGKPTKSGSTSSSLRPQRRFARPDSGVRLDGELTATRALIITIAASVGVLGMLFVLRVRGLADLVTHPG